MCLSMYVEVDAAAQLSPVKECISHALNPGGVLYPARSYVLLECGRQLRRDGDPRAGLLSINDNGGVVMTVSLSVLNLTN